MQQASAQLTELASSSAEYASTISTDPANAVASLQEAQALWNDTANAWQSISDAFGQFDASVTNAEVKAASAPLVESAATLSSEIKKVYVDMDFSGLDQLTATQESFNDAYQTLTDVCTAN